jgi:hypothetical protein
MNGPLSHLPYVEVEIQGRRFGARRMVHVPRVGETVDIDTIRGTVTSVTSSFTEWNDGGMPFQLIRVIAE